MDKLLNLLGNIFFSGVGLFIMIGVMAPFMMAYFTFVHSCDYVCVCKSDNCVKAHRTSYAINLDAHKKFCKDSYTENCWKH